jgi:hypothetical protein
MADKQAKAGRDVRFFMMESGNVVNLDQIEVIHNATGENEGPAMIQFISGRKLEIPIDDLAQHIEIFNGPTWTD